MAFSWQRTVDAIFFFSLASVVDLIGCAESIDHDYVLAGRKAVEFAQVAFVKQDSEKGYALLSDAAKRYVSRDKFKETISRLHPKGYPTSVRATEFEPMPNEKAIYIFLIGENSVERFYYKLTMEGTAASDYKVSIIDSAYGAYPASPIRKPLHNRG